MTSGIFQIFYRGKSMHFNAKILIIDISGYISERYTQVVEKESND